MALPFTPDIEHAYMEYNRLLREYTDAREAYQVEDTKQNWDRMQKTLLALRKHENRRGI